MKDISTANSSPEFFDFLTKTGLSETVAEAVCSLSTTVSIEKDNSYSPIKNSIAFFYIKSGILIEESIFSNGTVVSCHLYGMSSILFTTAVLSDLHLNALSAYKAFCNSELILVNLGAFRALPKSHPTIIEYVHKGYAEQRAVERESAWLMNILDKRSIIIASLLTFGFQSKDLTFSISLEQLSRMLNVSRQHVNSIVNELVQGGYLEKKQNELHIVSPEGMIYLLPEILIDTVRTLSKLNIVNVDTSIFGKCALYLK